VAEILFGVGLAHMMVDNAPKAGVVLANEFRYLQYRHFLGQGQNERFKQLRKSTLRPAPWSLPLDSATGPALDPWVPEVDMALVLEEIQVAPTFLLAVMYRALCFPAFAATEFGTLLKVYLQIQSAFFFIELDCFYV